MTGRKRSILEQLFKLYQKDFVAWLDAVRLKADNAKELFEVAHERSVVFYGRVEVLENAAELLKEMEWTRFTRRCPKCINHERDGHTPECPIGNILARLAETAKGWEE
jgi:hypothetical protein